MNYRLLVLSTLMGVILEWGLVQYRHHSKQMQAQTQIDNRLRDVDFSLRRSDPLFQDLIIYLIDGLTSIDKPPFMNACNYLEMRRGRVIRQQGTEHTGFMPDGWQQALAMALAHNEEVFLSKAGQFLAMPVDKDLFKATDGRYRRMLIRGEPCLYWLVQNNHGFRLRLVRLNLIGREDVIAALHILEHQRAASRFTPLRQGYITAIFFGLPLVLLGLHRSRLKLMGFRYWSFKARITLVFFVWALTVLIPLLIYHQLENQSLRQVLRDSAIQETQTLVTRLMNEWLDFERDYLTELEQRFHSGQDLGSLLGSGGSMIQLDFEHRVAYFPESIEDLDKVWLNNLSQWLVPLLPGFFPRNDQEIANLFPVNNPFMNRVKMPRALQETLERGKTAKGDTYRNLGMGQGHEVTLLGQSHRLIWFATDEPSFRYNLINIRRSELQLRYFDKVLKQFQLTVSPADSEDNYLLKPIARAEGTNTRIKLLLQGMVWARLLDDHTLYAPVREGDFRLGSYIVVYILLAACLSYGLATFLLKPLLVVSEAIKETKRGKFPRISRQFWHPESQNLIQEFNQMSAELEDRQRLAPYVPMSLIQAFRRLQAGQIFKGEAAILVSDIRGFTSLSESMDPQEVVELLNSYFHIWQEQVDRHQGIVIRFIGDAIIAIFLKEFNPQYRQSAVEAALAVSCRLDAVFAGRIRNGCGIVQGQVELAVISGGFKNEILVLGGLLDKAEELEVMSKQAISSAVVLSPELSQEVRDLYSFHNLNQGQGMEVLIAGVSH